MQQLYLYIVPVVLFLSHYLGIKWDIKSKKNVEIVQSLAAGLSVGYVFLILLPEITRLGQETRIETMAVTLLGFVFFHALLKFVFRARNLKKRHFLLDEIHLLAVGIYHFVLTFSLTELFKNSLIEGFVLLFLIAIHNALSEISHHELHHEENKSLKTPTIFLTTMAGALVPAFGFVSPLMRVLMFSFTAGAIIYISIREELPEGKQGNPLFFMLGAFFLFACLILV